MIKNHPFTVIPGGLSDAGQFRTACPSGLSGNDFAPDDDEIVIILPPHVLEEMSRLYSTQDVQDFPAPAGELSDCPPASYLGRWLFGWGSNPDGSSDARDT